MITRIDEEKGREKDAGGDCYERKKRDNGNEDDELKRAKQPWRASAYLLCAEREK
jgi:hypothetical protein